MLLRGKMARLLPQPRSWSHNSKNQWLPLPQLLLLMLLLLFLLLQGYRGSCCCCCCYCCKDTKAPTPPGQATQVPAACGSAVDCVEKLPALLQLPIPLLLPLLLLLLPQPMLPLLPFTSEG